MTSQYHVFVEVASVHKGRGKPNVLDESIHTVFAFVYLAANLSLGYFQGARKGTPHETLDSSVKSGPGCILTLLFFAGRVVLDVLSDCQAVEAAAAAAIDLQNRRSW
jgi:hypothetical protein